MIRLDGYTLAELLFQTPPTCIYRARRDDDGMSVIVKVLDIAFPSRLQLARVRHEYDLVKSLDHPGIIAVYALEKLGHSPAIVMEDFGGLPLRTVMVENALSLADKLRIAKRIGEILGEIHRHGIIHRDVNPNNILINPRTGIVKIIDFSNASRLPHEDQQLESPDHLEGTLAYIAPEQTGRMNRPVDYRSDYYSLGITLYELFLQRRPFEAHDSMEMVHQHIAMVPPPLHTQDPSIPPGLSLIVQKLIEKNAENRYQSSVGMCRDLEECLAALTSGIPDATFVPGRHDRSDRFTLPAKLYGREIEIRQLMDAYASACAGEPGVMLVSGFSGIGKSSLINEIHKPIARSKGFFIAGKFDQFRRNIPYSALIQAFRSLLHQILTESDERIAHWRHRVVAALGENAQVIVDLLPELQHILGPQPAVPPLPPQEAQNRFNFCFMKFVPVFAQADHPLTLFLDDLQWADHPSLNLLERLSVEAGCRHILIIGAYRDNEVEASHPLRLALGRMKKAGAALDEIALHPLSQDVVATIAADTLGCPTAAVRPLADLVSQKTGGNPFFINQLLKTLHDSGLVSYDHQASAWTWDIGRIAGVGITDNVVALMSDSIRQLSAPAQQLLKLAACLGSQFTLHDIVISCEQSRDAIAGAFHEALHAGLIVPIGDDYKFFDTGRPEDSGEELEIRCRFLHDRVQQAAYDLLSDEEKTVTHSRIGSRLLQNTPESLVDDLLFDITNHLNLALAVVTDVALRRQLIDLNIRAAVKAKNAIAYQPALKHIETAQTLLAGLADEGPRLRFRILLERAECEHLNGKNDAAEEHYRQALQSAEDDGARAAVLEAMIHFHTNTGAFQQAYQTGRQALRLFGVSLPAGFIPPLFLADLAVLKWRMRGRTVAQLIDLPVCRDETAATAMRLICALLKAAYQIRPELCVANAVKVVNLSLKHGMIEDNAVPFLVFGGIFLGGVLGRHPVGYDFGQFALTMNARFNTLKQRSEVNFVSAYFTHFWLKPAGETEDYYRAAYESGLQTGDFFHLSCAACTLVESQYIRGVPLPEVKQLGGDYLAFLERINSVEAAGAITATLRAILNLEGLTETPASFGDPSFSEADFVGRLQGFTLKHFAHFYYVNKMQALYLWRRMEEALAVAQQSERYLKHSIAMLHTVEHHFYHALILCAAYDAAPKRAYLRQARKILRQFERWAQLNPANFAHKALLIRAEITRLSRQGYDTADLYVRAIASAEENGYLQNVALAHELAGRFFAARNVALAASGHLREACYGYQLWGAAGIADRLAHDFPHFVSLRAPESLPGTAIADREFPHRSVLHSGSRPRSVSVTSSISGSRSKSSLDLETVIKATRAISSEIKLSSLLQKLMKIMIENAGADRGWLLRNEQGRLVIEAHGTAEGTVEILEGVPVEDAPLPASILHYVAHLGESVVINDAQSDSRFWDDPYILATKPASLLCAPILQQSQGVGLIYLENTLVGGAFSPERLELLGILAAQAAISIENSQLYTNLEQRVQERTLELSLATEQLKTANEALEKLTLTDALTQISNKRHFQQVYDNEWKRAARSEAALTLMLIDIDCFKLYNDTYGHLEGDRCLKEVAKALHTVIRRAGELLARFGGEEFVVLLPNSDLEDAREIAARLVAGVRALQIPHKASTATDIVTISLGLAQMVPQQSDDPADLLTAADQALYLAKAGGRNRFCCQAAILTGPDY